MTPETPQLGTCDHHYPEVLCPDPDLRDEGDLTKYSINPTHQRMRSALASIARIGWANGNQGVHSCAGVNCPTCIAAAALASTDEGGE